jgi:hypothetical protein
LPLFETPHFHSAANLLVDELAKLYARKCGVVIGIFPYAQRLKVILFIDVHRDATLQAIDIRSLFKTFDM